MIRDLMEPLPVLTFVLFFVFLAWIGTLFKEVHHWKDAYHESQSELVELRATVSGGWPVKF